MKDVQLDSSRPATGTDATTTLDDRTTILDQLVITNYSALQDVAYTTYPGLLVFDAEKIITLLGKRLGRYTGPPIEAPFMKWAIRFVGDEALRYKIATQILAEQYGVIRAAIHEYLWTSAVNLSVEHQDVYWEIAELIFQRAHSLNRRGKAKLSTRVTALVKKHCYMYHNSKNARRRKLLKARLTIDEPILCERLSDEEIASISPKDIYDPGYSEAGLSIS